MRSFIVVVALLACSAVCHAQEWERLTPPDLNAGVPVLDSKRGEIHLLSLESGARPGDEWILDTARPDRWRRISAGGSGPQFDDARGAFYDVASDRILVLARDPSAPNGSASMTVWARSLARRDGWRRLADEGPAPIERWEYAFVLDNRRSEYVLFGGSTQEFGFPQFNDVWRLHLEDDRVTWTRVETTGDSLSSRAGMGAIYDARRDRMVIYGGSVGLGGQAYQEVSGDVITIQFGETAHVDVRPGVPSEDFAHEVSHASCMYDSLADRMVATSYNSWAQPVRTLDLEDLSTWVTVVPMTGPSNDLRVRWIAPESSGRSGLSISGLPVASRIELGPPYAFRPLGPGPDQIEPSSFSTTLPSFPDFGDGSTWVWGGFLARDPASVGTDPAPVRTMWRFAPDEFPHWSRHDLSGEVPSAVRNPTTAYDGRRGRGYLFGGDDPAHPTELWSFDVATSRWSRIDDGASAPSARAGAILAYDGLRDRLILWGGKLRTGPYAQDAWAWSLARPSGWAPIHVSTRRPHDRTAAVGAYDAAHDRLVIHGGSWRPSLGGIGVGGFLVDTWALRFGEDATWDSLGADPRAGATSAAFYDPARRAVDLLERRRDSSSLVGGLVLQQLDGDHWTDVVVGGLSGSYAVAFDEARDRLLSFGGGHLSSAWALDRPEPAQLAFIDVRRDGASGGPLTVVVHGGPALNVADLDPASCTLAGVAAARDPRSDKASLRDVDSDGFVDRLVRFDVRSLGAATGLVEFSGRLRSGLQLLAYARLNENLDRTPVLTSGDPDSPHDTVREFSIAASGFERGAGVLRLELPERSRVRVEIFSVNGRRVAGRDLGQLEAGVHELGGLGAGEVRAGVYFVRAVAGTAVAQSRFISIP